MTTTIEHAEPIAAPVLPDGGTDWSLALRAAFFRQRRAIIGWGIVLAIAAIYMGFTMWRFDAARDAMNLHCATPCEPYYDSYIRWSELAANGGLEIFAFAFPAAVGLFFGIGAVDLADHPVRVRFLWTQGMSRTRWIGSQIAVLAVTVTVFCGLAAALFNWWVGQLPHMNSTGQTVTWGYGQGPFTKASFDISGFVMIGYGLFALALGIFLASLFPRIVAAVGGFILFAVVRSLVWAWRVAGYLPPAAKWGLPGKGVPLPFHSSLRAQGLALVGQPHVASLSLRKVAGIVSRCTNSELHRIANTGAPVPNSFPLSSILQAPINHCEAAHGVRELALFLPPSDFWWYQSIEFALFCAFAMVLAIAAVAFIRRRNV